MRLMAIFSGLAGAVNISRARGTPNDVANTAYRFDVWRRVVLATRIRRIAVEFHHRLKSGHGHRALLHRAATPWYRTSLTV